MSGKPIELLENPNFVADLKNIQLSGHEVARKWQIAETTARKWRKRLLEKDGLPTASKVKDLETLDYSESSDGSKSAVSAIRDRPITLEDARDWVRSSGDDPDDYNISVRSTAYGEGLFSNKQSAVPKPGIKKSDPDLTINDLPLLYSQVNTLNPSEYWGAAIPKDRSLVVIWADIQVGKTGSRGGTPELIKRIAEKRVKLEGYIADQNAKDAYFLSVGDEVESFENTPQQMFTNDLSFPDQLDLELTFELEMISLLAGSHESVTVAGCSSNHCRWRAGKNALGKPSDDYGLYIKRQLEKALRLNSSYDHVTFQYPQEWDETMAVDVQGTKIGLAHGHQVSNPNQIESWWTKQAFGGQAIADASILATGHFHTFRAQPMGRDASGKNRWWLQAPTLDNSSDWFRNIAGSDSDPGLLVFCVDENGLDLQSLTIL